LSYISTIGHFASYMCFVSASWQTIATFYQPEDRNLGRITGISPCWRLSDSTEIYSIGIDHKQPTDDRDYRRESSLLMSKSIAYILHFRTRR